MQNTLESIKNILAKIFTTQRLCSIILAIFVLVLLWLLYKLCLRFLKNIKKERLSMQSAIILQKITGYAFFIIAIMYILSLFGIKLSALLGAAGIAGIAVGFAAQTTVSNLISGLFVITEGAIHIGDFIELEGVSGTVDSFNLLATTLHTNDNLMIRLPNSKISNCILQNNSYFPIKRMQFLLGVRYGTDIKTALSCFLEAPPLCPTVLSSPPPSIWVTGFGDNNINITLAVWYKSTDLIETKNAMFIALQQIMKEKKLEMAFTTIELVK